MNKSLRTIALIAALTTGTVAAYLTAWLMMPPPVEASVLRPADLRKAPKVDHSDICTSQEYVGDRAQCVQAVGGTTKTVRVISIIAPAQPAQPTNVAASATSIVR